MAAANGASVERRGGTHESVPLEGSAGAAKRKPLDCEVLGALRSRCRSGTLDGKCKRELGNALFKIASTSNWAAVCGRSNRSIRKNIIGHGMAALRRGLAGGSARLCVRGALPLLHQPARQHGRRCFLHPFVEKHRNLLAEIGGVREAGEFKTLQRIARSREQKLPRGWLWPATGHLGLLGLVGRKLTVSKLTSRVLLD